MTTLATRMTALVAAAAMVVPSVPAVAETPGSVRDLVGRSASDGEGTLEYRGFHYITGSTRNNRKFNYWWNGNTKECIRVVTYNGRYETIDKTTNADCNQKGGGGDTAAAIAVGAAALLGIAALASKSHHREDRYQDERGTAEFERGYRDGLYNAAYHNYSRSDAYSHGYERGVEERSHQTSYRANDYNRGGYGSYFNINDLVGQQRDRAIGEMGRRGFGMRDNKRVDDGRYITFWNGDTRQCVLMHSQNGYVETVETVSTRTCQD